MRHNYLHDIQHVRTIPTHHFENRNVGLGATQAHGCSVCVCVDSTVGEEGSFHSPLPSVAVWYGGGSVPF